MEVGQGGLPHDISIRETSYTTDSRNHALQTEKFPVQSKVLIKNVSQKKTGGRVEAACDSGSKSFVSLAGTAI